MTVLGRSPMWGTWLTEGGRRGEGVSASRWERTDDESLLPRLNYEQGIRRSAELKSLFRQFDSPKGPGPLAEGFPSRRSRGSQPASGEGQLDVDSRASITLTIGSAGSLALSECEAKGSVSFLWATKRWLEVKWPDCLRLELFWTVRYLRR